MPKLPPVAWPWAANLAGAAGNVAVAYGATHTGGTATLGFTAVRFAIGALVLAPVAVRLTRLHRWEWAVVALEIASIVALFAALATVPAATVAALSAASPLAAAAAGRALGQQKLTRLTGASIAVAAAGTLGLAGSPAWGGSAVGAAYAVASMLAATAASVTYAHYARTRPSTTGPWTLTSGVNTAGAFVLIPAAVATGTWQPTPAVVATAAVVVMTGGVLGMWLTLRALTQLPAAVVLAHAPLGTALTAIGAAAVLGQQLTAATIGWLAVISVAVIGLALGSRPDPQPGPQPDTQPRPDSGATDTGTRPGT